MLSGDRKHDTFITIVIGWCARFVFVSVALLAWSAQAAYAGQISFEHDEGFGTLVFDAVPGEANDVSIVGPDPADLLHVTDQSAPLTAGPGCVSVNPNEATCLIPFFEVDFVEARLRLGDMDDRIVEDICGDLATVSISGGPGADHLSAGTQQAVLYGGPGPDVMEAPAGTCSDGGSAIVTYGGRTEAVFASLDGQANDGESGEGDLIGAGVFWIVGGFGNDVLRGGLRGDQLEGRGGSDLIIGRGGSDFLLGQGGNDRVSGGKGVDSVSGGVGDDVVEGNQASDSEVLGGPGRDIVDGGLGDDRLGATGGPDVVRGGPGNDRINARDGHRDRISGGLGRDRGWVDRGLDSIARLEGLCLGRCW